MGQMWCLIVSIPYLCPCSYFTFDLEVIAVVLINTSFEIILLNMNTLHNNEKGVRVDNLLQGNIRIPRTLV